MLNTKDKLDLFYWGEFSLEKMLIIKELPDLHIYGEKKWPTHQFIGTIPYDETCFLGQCYSRALAFNEEESNKFKELGLEVVCLN